MHTGGRSTRRYRFPLAGCTLVAAVAGIGALPGVAGATSCVTLGSAGNYGEYTTAGSALTNETVQGSAAYGSDSSLFNSTVASSSGPPASQVTLVVGGSLNSAPGYSGTVGHGSAVYVGSYTSGSILTPGGGTVAKVPASGLPFQFAATEAALTAASGTFSSLGNTGSPTTSGSTLTLAGTGTGAATNVFSITENALKAATALTVSAPAGAVVVINVTGVSALTLSHQTATLSGGVVANDIVWNFVAVGSMALTSEKWQGTILEPNGTLAATNSTIVGSLLGGATGQFTGNTVDQGLFTGCVPPNLGTGTPEVPMNLLLPLAAVGVGGLTYAFRRGRTPPTPSPDFR